MLVPPGTTDLWICVKSNHAVIMSLHNSIYWKMIPLFDSESSRSKKHDSIHSLLGRLFLLCCLFFFHLSRCSVIIWFITAKILFLVHTIKCEKKMIATCTFIYQRKAIIYFRHCQTHRSWLQKMARPHAGPKMNNLIKLCMRYFLYALLGLCVRMHGCTLQTLFVVCQAREGSRPSQCSLCPLDASFALHHCHLSITQIGKMFSKVATVVNIFKLFPNSI